MMKNVSVTELGALLLKVGTSLMCSGASTSRTRMIIDRIAMHYHVKADLFITHRALTITITDPVTHESYSRLKRTPVQGVNFKMVSGISHLSWSLIEHDWDLNRVKSELHRLETITHYNRWVILTAVGIADACFCYFSGGDFEAMGVAFIATVGGLFIRQETVKKNFNHYLCVFFAAFTATLIAGGFGKLFPGEGLEAAFASCVLFLIPGVPIINAVTDLFEGNLLNGLIRAVHALMFAFMIAVGMTLSVTIYQM